MPADAEPVSQGGGTLSDSPDRVLLAGDTHGDGWWWRHLVKLAKRHRCQGIVQLGDFGVWPGGDGKRYLNGVSAQLHHAGLWGIFIDGNHEDFPQLLGYPVQPDGWRPVRPALRHAPRGHRWSWRGVTFLALGGAGSVDKRWRTPGRDWWSEESITDDDVVRAVQGGKVDVMLTHDAPTRARPVALADSHWDVSGVGVDVLADCEASQRRLQQVVDAVQPRLLVHGHWHLWRDDGLDHPDGSRYRIVGLDCNRSRRTAAVLDLPSLNLATVD